MLFTYSLFLIVIIIYVLMSNGKQFNKKTQNNLFLRIVMFILFILVAIRDFNIGNDTQMYLNLYERCCRNKWDIVRFDGYFEGGYLILNILLSYISESPRFFMFAMSFIFNLVVYLFIKKNSKNYLGSVLMYIGLLFFHTSMTMMRQFLAMMIILSGLRFIKERKLIYFVLTVVFASLFHSSAWVALIIYPLYKLQYNKKILIISIFVSLMCLTFLEPVVNSYMNVIGRTNYYESRFGSDSLANSLSFVVYLVLFIVALVNRERMIKKDKEFDFFLNVLLVTACISLISTDMNVLTRVAHYFDIFSIITIPNVIACIDNKKEFAIYNIVLMIFLILYSGIIIKFRPNWNSAYNYKSSFFNLD